MKGTKLAHFFSKNAAIFMTVGGVLVMVGGTVLAVRNAPKVEKKLEEAYFKKNTGKNEEEWTELTFIEKVKTVGPVWFPVLLLEAGGAGMIIFSDVKMVRDKAIAVSTAEITGAALKEWKEATAEVVDQKTMEQIHHTMTRRDLEKDPPTQFNTVNYRKPGDVLFKDKWSGRYFWATQNEVDIAISKIRKEIDIRHRFNPYESEDSIDEFVPLNDYYELLKLDKVGGGDDVGWWFSMMYNHDILDVVRSDYDELPDGTIARVLSFNELPRQYF